MQLGKMCWRNSSPSDTRSGTALLSRSIIHLILKRCNGLRNTTTTAFHQVQRTYPLSRALVWTRSLRHGGNRVQLRIFQRALAARRALSLRCFFDNFFAVASPPKLPASFVSMGTLYHAKCAGLRL